MVSLKDIKFVVDELVGRNALPIVLFLRKNPNSSEFDIAEVVDLKTKAIRQYLYQLFKHGILTFYKKKDKNKGWYIFYWSFQENNIPYLKQKILLEKLSKIEKRLQREQDNIFYICPNKCLRLDFDRAVNFNFTCPECGSILEQQDNSEIIEQLKKEAESIRKQLKKEFKLTDNEINNKIQVMT